MRKYIRAHGQTIPLEYTEAKRRTPINEFTTAGGELAHHPKVPTACLFIPELCEVLIQKQGSPTVYPPRDVSS
jgi:hypothetical protein